jgi:uncharacterized protein YndB with AHSA1/START domain
VTRATITEAAGALRAEPDGSAAVRLERLYDATPEELWSALTEPERLRGWLADMPGFDLDPGAAFELHFEAASEPSAGRVVTVVPGRVLEWEWHEAGRRSLVRFEVEPRGAGALLVLDHRLLELASAPGYGAGWQGHLEALEALLGGTDPVDPHARYLALRPAWARMNAEH